MPFGVSVVIIVELILRLVDLAVLQKRFDFGKIVNVVFRALGLFAHGLDLRVGGFHLRELFRRLVADFALHETFFPQSGFQFPVSLFYLFVGRIFADAEYLVIFLHKNSLFTLSDFSF